MQNLSINNESRALITPKLLNRLKDVFTPRDLNVSSGNKEAELEREHNLRFDQKYSNQLEAMMDCSVLKL